jgi:hypothetical protein
MPLTVTGRLRRTRGHESGQILMLALGLFILLLGFAAIVVDGGFYLQRRERIQHITDAAALAGSQELPDDPGAAAAAARQWADRNGLDGDSIDVSFECRPDSPCDPSGVNTIIVEGHLTAPVALMPVLRLAGASGSSCWLSGGCTVYGEASAEAVTEGGPAPMDIVLVLDRTGSMNGEDLDNARDGARAMLAALNAKFQDVGLALLPPSQSQSFNGVCQPDTSEPWSPGDNWLVSTLANDYQWPDGSLDYNSRLLRIINCLWSGGSTNIGYPMQAAYEHLMNDGRPDANKAIVLLSDGAANQPRDGNPCTLAAGWADTAKDHGVEIYTIGYGVDDRCDYDSGYWHNKTAAFLLNYMATDDDHFFNQPDGSDLTDVFETIGQELSAGYRLVD